MPMINRLYLIIHPTRDLAASGIPAVHERFLPKWERLFAEEGPRQENALCILSCAKKSIRTLDEWGKRYFESRYVLDPCDDGPETRLIMMDDLQRTITGRGHACEWTPYELWSSNFARRWTEGLKKEWAARGLTYNPETLTVKACGSQWQGCLTKYGILMPKYLGVNRATDIDAALSPEAGYPAAAEFVERIAMDRQVWLFLFKTNDGFPMAQFMDGLRAVWEPPHVVSVPIDPARVEISVSTSNSFLKADTPQTAADRVFMDVGDGMYPAYTTLITTTMSYDKFREALAAGTVRPRIRNRVLYTVPYADAITMRHLAAD